MHLLSAFMEVRANMFIIVCNFYVLGVAGLYDYGPPGCALQANILSTWRNHFILEEGMLEVDTTVLTPHDVLKTSGHVERFTDYMVKDSQTGDFYRADHLVKAALEKVVAGAECSCGDASNNRCSRCLAEFDLTQLDGMDGETLNLKIKQYQILTERGNAPSQVMKFNLMFGSDIGPTGGLKGYMRPETAQGQFVNFKRLLECNNDKMPFASAQIGKSFRNEISPRSGLLRVREFTMAEIEHFVHPLKKQHSKFKDLHDCVLPLLSKEIQAEGSSAPTCLKIGDAVEKGIVNNETLGYFLARIYLFLIKIGIDKNLIRFRQHLSNEMAHYASDCWDAEIRTSYGWIECVGCADRAAFDLSNHSLVTGEKLVARERYSEPKMVSRWKITIDKKLLGQTFKKDAKKISDYLESLTQTELEHLSAAPMSAPVDISLPNSLLCPSEGSSSASIYSLDRSIFSIAMVDEILHVEEYIPNVIEPSFGIGRILYSLLEHSLWTRSSDASRHVLSFPPSIAPTKVLIAPIMAQDVFMSKVQLVATLVRSKDLSAQVDTSGTSLGKKYARNDEIGIPFSVTVDHRTLQDESVTLRERDSTRQIRLPIANLPQLLHDLVFEKLSWPSILSSYEQVAVEELEAASI